MHYCVIYEAKQRTQWGILKQMGHQIHNKWLNVRSFMYPRCTQKETKFPQGSMFIPHRQKKWCIINMFPPQQCSVFKNLWQKNNNLYGQVYSDMKTRNKRTTEDILLGNLISGTPMTAIEGIRSLVLYMHLQITLSLVGLIHKYTYSSLMLIQNVNQSSRGPPV